MPLKSVPENRRTGRHGGLTVGAADSLINVATGMGAGGDRSSHAYWRTHGGGDILLDRVQVVSAYMANWLIAKIHDIPPEDMTKAWRSWSADPKQVEALEAEERRLQLREKTQTCLREGLFGGGALILGLPGATSAAAPLPQDVEVGGLRYIMPVSRHQLSTPEFNLDLQPTDDPREPQFNEPYYFTFGQNQTRIHPSRVIVFPGKPVPLGSQLPRSEHFWGRPWLERINAAMKRAETAQHNIADLLHDLKTDVISIPGLSNMVSTAEGTDGLTRRMIVSKEMASQFAVKLLDGGDGTEGSGEEWETRQINASGLPDLMLSFIQMAAGATDLPLTRLTGTQAKGLNNGGEQDEANHMENMRTRQTTELKPRLDRLDGYLKASAGVNPDDAKVTWTFGDLKKMDPKAEAEIDKLIAECVKILAESGVIPEDGLFEAFKAKMIDRATWPGFEKAMQEAVEEIPGLREARLQEEGMQAANENETRKIDLVAKGAGASGRAKARRAANDAMVEDFEPRSLYVSRRVLNPQDLLRHYRAQGVENLVAPRDMHVTILYSREAVDWFKMPNDWSSNDRNGRLIVQAGGPRASDLFGLMDETLVLMFKSGELTWRHEALVEAGAKHSWPDFAPHVTIVKRVPHGFDASAVKPYAGRIVLGPEIFEEVVEESSLRR